MQARRSAFSPDTKRPKRNSHRCPIPAAHAAFARAKMGARKERESRHSALTQRPKRNSHRCFIYSLCPSRSVRSECFRRARGSIFSPATTRPKRNSHRCSIPTAYAALARSEMDAYGRPEGQPSAVIQHAPSEIHTGVLLPQLMPLSHAPKWRLTKGAKANLHP